MLIETPSSPANHHAGYPLKGTFYAIYILEGQLIKPSEENDLDKKIGVAMMVLFVTGFIGSLCAGFLVDSSGTNK